MSLVIGLIILAGAFVYRMRGGMPPSFARPADQIIFAFPFSVMAALQCTNIWGWEYYGEGFLMQAVVLAATAGAVAKGHGNNMDLGEQDKGPEWYEPVILWAKPHMPLYWYDALGLAISGLTYTIPCGLATLNPWIALSGAFKAPCYMLSKKADARTEGGELLTGGVLWGVLAVEIWVTL